MFYRYLKLITILYLCTTHYQKGLSQEGTPIIFNHKKSEYKASVVNFDIMSAENGNIYVANGGGMMEYNGKDWANNSLPNGSIVRSLFIDKKRIYVGGQDEIGFFERTSGEFIFHSLREKISPKHLPLEDVWDIQVQNETVYFLSKDRVYIIKGDSSEVIYTGNPTYGLTSTESGVFFNDKKEGIYQIIGFEYKLYLSQSELEHKEIAGLSGSQNKLIIYTLENEIFISDRQGKFYELRTNIDDYLKSNRIRDIQVNKDVWVIGTRFGGIVVLNRDGTLKHIINKKKGLQNDAINQLSLDINGNIWTASSNGIDNILINGRKQLIFPDGELQGSIFDIVEFQGRMYYATSNGLYVQNMNETGLKKETFNLVNGSEGQVWGLDILDKTLFMAHNEGAFIIQNNSAIKISPGIGAWKFTLTPDKNHMYVGTYFGVDLYQKKNNKWSFQKTFKYPEESSRILVNGKGNNLWISHPYRGVYRMIIDENFDLIRADPFYGQKGLPSHKLNYIFEVRGKMIVAAEKGIYEYDMIKDEFVESEWLNTILPKTKNIRHIQTDEKGNIWYITVDEVVKLTITNGTITSKEYFPELVDKFVGGFENLFLAREDLVFACSDQGVIKYDISEKTIATSLETNLISLSTSDSIYFFENGSHQINTFDYKHNSIILNYSSNWARPDIDYSYLLTNSDNTWSDWSTMQTKEYTNLLSGRYTFKLKARSPDGIESETYTYSFSVSPPWYKSKLAYAFYSMIGILIIIGLLHIPNKKYQRDKALLEGEKLQTQEELKRLKIEKLQNEIQHQNSELASSTMHLVQKNTTLNKVKTDIETIRKNIKDTEIKKQLKKVLSSLNDDVRLEEDWEGFAMHFDKVHSDFLKRLKANHPNLSPKDLKLAAYLRMNLNTKEIAPLLNISVRGVEISRYRLRKKLDLTTETNLSDWMLSF